MSGQRIPGAGYTEKELTLEGLKGHLGITIMVGHGREQADMVQEQMLRVLHLVQATGSHFSHWAWLEHI